MYYSKSSPPPRWQTSASIMVVLCLALALVRERWSRGRSVDMSDTAVEQKACQALCQSVHQILEITNWVMQSEQIASGYYDLSSRYNKNRSLLEGGDTRLALMQLADLNAACAKLAMHNVLAGQAAESRRRLNRARDGLSPKLQAVINGDRHLVGLFESGEIDWKLGDFSAARDGFDEAFLTGRLRLENAGTKEDVNAWLAADAAGEMARLQGVVNGQAAQIQDLQKSLKAKRKCEAEALRAKGMLVVALAEAGSAVQKRTGELHAAQAQLGIERELKSAALQANGELKDRLAEADRNLDTLKMQVAAWERLIAVITDHQQTSRTGPSWAGVPPYPTPVTSTEVHRDYEVAPAATRPGTRPTAHNSLVLGVRQIDPSIPNPYRNK